MHRKPDCASAFTGTAHYLTNSASIKKACRAVLLFWIIGVFPLLPILANPIIWTNSNGGNWDAPENWNPNGLPDDSSDVIITNAGSYTVSLNSEAQVSSITLGSDDVSGAQSLTINAGGALYVSGDGFHSGVIVKPKGILNIDSTSMRLFGSLTNAGTINLTNATIQIFDSATSDNASELTNQVEGQIHLYGSSAITGTNSETTTFVNNGSLTFSSPTIQSNMLHQSRFDSYPVLARSPDERTNYMAFQAMAGNFYTSNSAICFATSANDSVSWSKPSVIVTNANTQLWNPALGVTHSGRLVLLYQPIKIGAQLEPQPTVSLISDDGGATWLQVGTVRTNDLPPVGIPFDTWTAFGPVTECNGRLYVGYYAHAINNWFASYCLTSEDDGSNWVGHLITFDGMPSEPSVLPINSNLVMCVARSQIWSLSQIRFPKMFCYWSTNGGTGWSSGGDWLKNVEPVLNDPACLGVFQSPNGPNIAMAWGNRTDCKLYISRCSVEDAMANFSNLYSNRLAVDVIANRANSAGFDQGGYPEMVALNDHGLYLLTWYYEGAYSDPYIGTVRMMLVDFSGTSSGLTNVPVATYELPGSIGTIAVSKIENSNGSITNQSLAGTLQIAVSSGGLAGKYEALANTKIGFSGGNALNPIEPGVPLQLGGDGQYQFKSGYLRLPSDLIPGLELSGGTLTLGNNFQGGGISDLTINGMTLTNTLPVTGRLDVTDNLVYGDFSVQGDAVMRCANGTVAGSITVENGGLLVASGMTLGEGGSLSVKDGGDVNVTSAPLNLYSALTNKGVINLTNSDIVIFNDGTLNNAGLLVNQSEGQIHLYGNGGIFGYYDYDTMINKGIITKTMNNSTARISLSVFDNPGEISVQTGVLSLDRVALDSTSVIEVHLNSATNFGKIAINNSVELDGKLSVKLSGDFVPANSDSFIPLMHNSYSGNFSAYDLPPLPSANWRLNHSDIALELAISGIPFFEKASFGDEGMVITGGGGTPGDEYLILESTNISLPPTNWMPVSTNAFSETGSFTFTNAVDLSKPQVFFRIQLTDR